MLFRQSLSLGPWTLPDLKTRFRMWRNQVGTRIVA
jgi:hypothetical protein